ncbi:DUF6070 family protein [Agathobacter rectalis]|nr:DUF6070 family protein [Agathobacter rectalis]
MKKRIWFIVLISCLLCGCIRKDMTSDSQLMDSRDVDSTEENENAKEDVAEQWEKGYDLPIDEPERKEAEDECKMILELISDIYTQADKGEAVNTVLDDKTIYKMQDRIKEKGYPVITMKAYAAMENYKKVEDFLKNCQEEKAGFIVLYELQSDGGIGRDKFIFDGKDMYLISACATWNTNDTYGLSYISYARIKEWKYTDKGWFCYELCVPEPPEVTEIVDGSCLVRIKPLSEEQREMSERCVQGLGYQGNNLLCSNWDTDHMEKLDYNGMYEYLYAMKHQKAFDAEDYSNGIPKEEFESLIMEYLPVTAEQIQEYAVFDEKNQTYVWVRLGCLNYAPTFFGTSLPEVIDIKENEDGTVTLTVDAVCDMVICDDAVITHELTVKFADDGSFQYLGNEILDDGIMHIPDYQYRIKE